MKSLSAPGKAFLCGEYAVLEGAPALVMAVDRRVVLRPGRGDPGGLVARGRERAAAVLGLSGVDPCAFEADSSALSEEGRKIGLGSSAAVAVVAVASVWWEAGRSLEPSRERWRLWEVAREVHDAHQKVAGSGGDLAVCLFGGVQVFRPEGFGRGPSLRPFPMPRGVRVVFAWTGRESATALLLQAFRRVREEAPHRVVAILEEMRRLAVSCVGRGPEDGEGFLRDLRAYGDGMVRLGEALGEPLVEDRTRRLAERLSPFGGAVKPSGAGAGDLTVAFLPESCSDEVFGDACAEAGLRPLPLQVSWGGVE